MRRTGRHAVTATFEPADDRVRAVLAQGAPLSSAARLVGRDDPGPVSLLLEACGSGGYDGLVRAELLVHPERTGALLAGVEFELLAGRRLLGCGKILRGTERLDSSMRHGRERGGQSTCGAIPDQGREGLDHIDRPSTRTEAASSSKVDSGGEAEHEGDL